MINLATIKNIIIDLGGVIINIDPMLSADEFRKAGFDNFDAIYTKFKQDRFFDKFETGHITTDEFYLEMKKHTSLPITDKQIDDAWNKMLLDFPEERIALLQKLKKRYKLFLLSNTNQIHYKTYTKLFRQEYFFEFNSLFVKTYYSFKQKMKKPYAEFFELVLKENNLNPGETLFVDDTLVHIEAAGRLGIKTYWLKEGETISDVFGY
ncbi:MAG: HAD family phosphatase [Bacteroidia bacterium]|nr:HAD family phosphatase [Bacteroidia bacterium]